MAVSGVSGTGASTSAANTAGKSLADNFDTFLTLLTKQLQNQDPLSPMDSNQFTQQLVQYSGVEQSIATNKNLEQMLSYFRGQQATDAVGYIGKEITAEGPEAYLGEAGELNWKFAFDGAPKTATVQVVNSAGTVVHQTTLENPTGMQSVDWDGNLGNGSRALSDIYTLKITGLDADGQSVTSSIYTTGVVDGVETVDGIVSVTINGVSIPADAVRAVRTPTTTSAS